MNRVRRPWSAEENEKLKSLAGKVPLRQIARQLKRTEGATGVQASNLRISVKLVSSPAATLNRKTTSDRKTAEPPVALKAKLIEGTVGPAAIERALSIYEQLQQHDQSVIAQARKILTQHIYGMIDQGEYNEHKLTVGGLARLKAVERDHDIKSAHETVSKSRESAEQQNGEDLRAAQDQS
jgi:hypothetical protein